MRDAEAALAQPEAVEPVMRSLTNDEHLLVVQSLIDSSSTTPLAPYERMRRALERIKNRCNSTENAYVLLADIFNEANEALVHAGEGKESDGATQDTETIHQTIYKHAYKSLKGRVSERFLQEEFWLAAEDAAKEIALTPPDITAQREEK